MDVMDQAQFSAPLRQAEPPVTHFFFFAPADPRVSLPLRGNAFIVHGHRKDAALSLEEYGHGNTQTLGFLWSKRHDQPSMPDVTTLCSPWTTDEFEDRLKHHLGMWEESYICLIGRTSHPQCTDAGRGPLLAYMDGKLGGTANKVKSLKIADIIQCVKAYGASDAHIIVRPYTDEPDAETVHEWTEAVARYQRIRDIRPHLARVSIQPPAIDRTVRRAALLYAKRCNEQSHRMNPHRKLCVVTHPIDAIGHYQFKEDVSELDKRSAEVLKANIPNIMLSVCPPGMEPLIPGIIELAKTFAARLG
ncbi:hypothetical protein HKX48_000014 [Thoreauomyces humboldtii]|nr:hypothetical protein HKX48_000014 [Thoreauomyces humboldtii]